MSPFVKYIQVEGPVSRSSWKTSEDALTLKWVINTQDNVMQCSVVGYMFLRYSHCSLFNAVWVTLKNEILSANMGCPVIYRYRITSIGIPIIKIWPFDLDNENHSNGKDRPYIGMFLCSSGLVLKLPFCNRPEGDELFEDGPWWQVAEGQPDAEIGHGPDHDMQQIIPNEHAPAYGSVSGWVSAENSRYMDDSSFAPSQWETALLCNDVSHRLGVSLESAL